MYSSFPNRRQPTVIVIAGPNGAGKSTFYETHIKPRFSAPFINADVIQRNELEDKSALGAYEAAHLAAERRATLIEERKSFVTESIFSHPTKLDFIHTAKTAGFRIIFYHIHVIDPRLSIARVQHRVKRGGHDVPVDKIAERFQRNQPYIRSAVLLADKAFVFDNSRANTPPRLILVFAQGRVESIVAEIPTGIDRLYRGEILAFNYRVAAPILASLEEAKTIAKRYTDGKSATVITPPFLKQMHFAGEIIAESALHVLQKTNDDTFIAHFKNALDRAPRVGKEYTIHYKNNFSAHVNYLEDTPS